MSDFHYIYPRFRNLSFSIIAKEHIRVLKDRVKIQEIDEEALDNLQWLKPRNIILHPILYVTIGDKASIFTARQKRLDSLIKIKKNIGGFETADTDKISRVAVDTLNKLDVVFLPSQFTLDILKNSGVKIPMHIVPHGITQPFLEKKKPITTPEIKKIADLKEYTDAKLALFFMLHSEYRKGGDIIYETFQFLQDMFKDLYLVVKCGKGDNDTIKKLRKLKLIEIPSWLTEEQKKELYDICDMVVVPSRGGGFEVNALEGIARGIPTIVPDAGCFKDYIKYCVPVPVSSNPKLFSDNPIHTGNGWEVSADDLGRTIAHVVNTLDIEKERAQANVEEIRKQYSWEHIGDNLYDLLKMYGFVGES